MKHGITKVWYLVYSGINIFICHSQFLHDNADWFKYVPKILSYLLIQLLFTGSSYSISLEPLIVCLCIYGHIGNINLNILTTSDMNLNFNFSFLFYEWGYYVQLIWVILYLKLPFFDTSCSCPFWLICIFSKHHYCGTTLKDWEPSPDSASSRATFVQTDCLADLAQLCQQRSDPTYFSWQPGNSFSCFACVTSLRSTALAVMLKRNLNFSLGLCCSLCVNNRNREKPSVYFFCPGSLGSLYLKVFPTRENEVLINTLESLCGD